MRQLPLVFLALLVPANAVSAVRYHTRATLYACVDPRALSSRDPLVRAQGRCFKVVPRETWERISRNSHSLLLLRIKPPHPGEPPLYFRRSSLVLMHAHRRPVRHHHLSVAETAPPHAPSLWHSVPLAASVSHPAPQGAITHPLQASTEPAGDASDQPHAAPAEAPDKPAPKANPGSAVATATPSVTLPSEPAPSQVASQVAAQATQTEAVASPHFVTQQAPAGSGTHQEKGRAYHLIWPLLLWAVMIAFAGLLVQLVLRRRPAEAAAAPASRRESATVPRSSIWEPVHPDLPGIVEKLAPDEAADAQSEPVAPASQAGTMETPPATVATSGSDPISLSDYKNSCVARLRHAGWDARTRFTGGQRGPDVIARHNGLVLALQCHPSVTPVDVEAVEDACLVRERQRSDLAAIVSNATYTEAARQLAARTGIVLLHEDQLASFAA